MILVTGASGFLGSAIVRKLINRRYIVRGMVRKTSDCRNLEGLNIDLVEGDLLDKTSLRKALKDCSGLFHVAAEYRLWAPAPVPVFNANV
jgi:dihydroflavonol-4-reductase